MTIIDGSAILRIRRMFDKSTDTITVFSFPKLPTTTRGVEIDSKRCVFKVTVSWRNFQMNYTVTPLATFPEVE